MSNEFDARVVETRLYEFPIATRIPLAFGRERATEMSVLRAAVTLRSTGGASATGWADVPLNVQWAWPSSLTEEERRNHLMDCATRIGEPWVHSDLGGHPVEIYADRAPLIAPESLGSEAVPPRAFQLVLSLFDLATHDAYGVLHGVPTYQTYSPRYMNRDLASLLGGSSYAGEFALRYPSDYLSEEPQRRILAWHMVGKEDHLRESEVPADVAADGYPRSLEAWIEQDGLQALKVKLGAENVEADVDRFLSVWDVAAKAGIRLTSIDFNGTLSCLSDLEAFLDALERRSPDARQSLCYVEEPCPIEGCSFSDVDLANRGFPLLILDESVSTWRELEEAVNRGWRGVALKSCKGQSESLLMLALAKELGLRFTIQDLTNPMLAQLTHLLLGAHSGAPLGVESNCMQFYPEASLPEAEVHPGAYRRSGGELRLDSIVGAGFGYRIGEIKRALPEPFFETSVADASVGRGRR